MTIVLGRNWGGDCGYSNKLESVGDFYSCNFLSILHPFLGIFIHSCLCDAFYRWNCHLFRKKTQLKWWPQTNNCCVPRYWVHKSSIFSKSRHRRPSTNVQTDLHMPGLAGWILCADQKTKWYGQVTHGEEATCVSRLKLTQASGSCLHRGCCNPQVTVWFRKQACDVGGFFTALQNIWRAKGTEELCQLQQWGGTATQAVRHFWRWWMNIRTFWIDMNVQQKTRRMYSCFKLP